MTTVQVRLLPAARRAASPWLNGGGITREVAGFPDGSGLADFHWRVSLADVAQGGPFSRFERVDRVITVVEGAGMALTVDGAEHRLAEPYRPFAFSGEAATDCRLLEGPVVDFNVMTRRGKASAEVEIADFQRDLTVPPDASVLLVCLTGTAELGAAGVSLERYDAALLTGAGEEQLRVDGVVAVVTLRA
ncbi:HutD family protein [Kitasatospora sp. NPDC096147]|uniref:HutD/Ves family protein n=1 Tax=Kitasatospora sp. NPDC096147 TaxID=3364093 RepID=UPI0037FD9801